MRLGCTACLPWEPELGLRECVVGLQRGPSNTLDPEGGMAQMLPSCCCIETVWSCLSESEGQKGK